MNDSTEKQKPKRRKWAVILAVVLGILTVIGVAAIAVFNHFYNQMTPVSDEFVPDPVMIDEIPTIEDEDAESQLLKTIEENAESLPFADDVFSVLLLGNDSRNNDYSARTDAMMLISVNNRTKQIVLTSFLRDLYVYIPGWGVSNRLNAANVVGGPMMTIDTIEQNFGVKVDAYAELTFEGLETIVDLFGGIDVEMSASELKMLTRYGATSLGTEPGVYHLDGNHTLAYCRNRYSDSDFGRTNRQRIAVQKVWEKAKNTPIFDAYGLLEDILAQITTTVTKGQCLELLLDLAKFREYGIVSRCVPAAGTFENRTISGMMVLVADTEANTSLVRDAIYGAED